MLMVRPHRNVGRMWAKKITNDKKSVEFSRSEPRKPIEPELLSDQRHFIMDSISLIIIVDLFRNSISS